MRMSVATKSDGEAAGAGCMPKAGAWDGGCSDPKAGTMPLD